MTDTLIETVADAATATYVDRSGTRHPLPDLAADAQVRADDRGHVFHSWSAQALIDPLPIAAGEGSTFWDYAGNAYLDFSSQLVNLNLGHQHPDLVAAIQQQAGRLATIQPSMASDVLTLLQASSGGAATRLRHPAGGRIRPDRALDDASHSWQPFDCARPRRRIRRTRGVPAWLGVTMKPT